jgi:ribose 5-phosphate isomerase B
MKVVIGSDHAGYELKEQIKVVLEEKGCTIIDVGTESLASVDYPDFGIKAATLVGRGEVDRGVLICGTGVGMSIIANKVKGVRASLIYDLYRNPEQKTSRREHPRAGRKGYRQRPCR